MLQPSQTKHRKQFRGRRKGLAARGTEVSFGMFGLKALGRAWVSAKQIEAARRVMTHYTKRGGRIWIRIFPDKPITKKPAETRMGSGKGDVDHYAAVVRPGLVLFEMGAVTSDIAREAMRRAGHKLPIKTRFMERGEKGENQ